MIPQAYLLDKGNYPSDRFFIEQAKIASAIIEAAASDTNQVEVVISEDFIKEFLLQLDDDGYIVTYSGYDKLLVRW